MSICNLSIEEAETGKSWELAKQPGSPLETISFKFTEQPSLKILKKITDADLWFSHVERQVASFSHPCTYTHELHFSDFNLKKKNKLKNPSYFNLLGNLIP